MKVIVTEQGLLYLRYEGMAQPERLSFNRGLHFCGVRESPVAVCFDRSHLSPRLRLSTALYTSYGRRADPLNLCLYGNCLKSGTSVFSVDRSGAGVLLMTMSTNGCDHFEIAA